MGHAQSGGIGVRFLSLCDVFQDYHVGNMLRVLYLISYSGCILSGIRWRTMTTRASILTTYCTQYVYFSSLHMYVTVLYEGAAFPNERLRGIAEIG